MSDWSSFKEEKNYTDAWRRFLDEGETLEEKESILSLATKYGGSIRDLASRKALRTKLEQIKNSPQGKVIRRIVVRFLKARGRDGLKHSIDGLEAAGKTKEEIIEVFRNTLMKSVKTNYPALGGEYELYADVYIRDVAESLVERFY